MRIQNTTKTWKTVSAILGILIFITLFDINVEPRPFFETSDNRGSGSVMRNVSVGNSIDVVPVGIPAVYGAELGISYDDVSPLNPQQADMTIEKMAQLDLNLNLEGDNLERYIDILYHQHGGMSCEYCCGAASIIFENGDPACGCAHSYAMRGLTKYLILEHGSDISDNQILGEIGKWKVLFFPDIHGQKAAIMEENGIEVDYISLTTNAFRGIEAGSSAGGMVGGC